MKKNLENKKVSIIMNCHNGAKYLNKSISSIINQSYKNWELIFFDNKSEDDSKKILKNFRDKRIKYFKSKKFLKLYEARNLAIKKAKGKYICFCDNDDWWIKGKLKKQINFIKKNKNVNFVFSNLFVYNQKTKKSNLYFKYLMPSGKITQNLLNDYKLGIPSVLMSKKFFENKKFNKRYNIIGDFDFFLNLSLKENFYCIQEPLAYYRIHGDNFSKKIDIYVKEVDHWLKVNSDKFKKLNYSLKSLKFFFYKLRIKQLIRWGL